MRRVLYQREPVCLSVKSPIVARQQLGIDVLAATKSCLRRRLQCDWCRIEGNMQLFPSRTSCFIVDPRYNKIHLVINSQSAGSKEIFSVSSKLRNVALRQQHARNWLSIITRTVFCLVTLTYFPLLHPSKKVRRCHPTLF